MILLTVCSDEGYGRLILNNDIIIDNFGSQFSDAKSAVRISMSDFTYISELGRGEQGRIFLARHVPSDTTMAIKVRLTGSDVCLALSLL